MAFSGAAPGFTAAFTGTGAGFATGWLEAVPGLAVTPGDGFAGAADPCNAALLAAVFSCSTPCNEFFVFWRIVAGFCPQAVPIVIASAMMPVVSFMNSPTFSPEPGRDLLILPGPNRG